MRNNSMVDTENRDTGVFISRVVIQVQGLRLISMQVRCYSELSCVN